MSANQKAAIKEGTCEYLKHDLRGYGDRLYCCCGNWRGTGEVGFVEHRIAAIVKDVETDLRERLATAIYAAPPLVDPGGAARSNQRDADVRIVRGTT